MLRENGAGSCDFKRLEVSYARFIGSVQRLVASEHCTPLDMLHALSRARNRLVRLRACEERRPAALVALLKGAVSHLEFEMRMVHLRIEHSAVMNRLREPEKPRSALYLAEPFTPTDLMELISALHLAGVGRPYRRYPCQRGTVGRAVLVDVQCPHQQSHPMLPCGRQSQTAADAVS